MIDMQSGIELAYEKYKAAEAARLDAEKRLIDWQNGITNLPAVIRVPLELLSIVGVPVDEPRWLADPVFRTRNETRSYYDHLGEEMAHTFGRYPVKKIIDFRNSTIGVEFQYIYPGEPSPFVSTLYSSRLFRTISGGQKVQLEVRGKENPLLHVPAESRIPIEIQTWGMGSYDDQIIHGFWSPPSSQEPVIVNSQEIATTFVRS